MGYYLKNKECFCQQCHIHFLSYRTNTKFCSPKCNNLYIYKNRDKEAYNLRKRSKSAAPYKKTRYNSDPNFRLSTILRSRLTCALKGNQKSGSAIEDLGCSINDLKKYLESKFEIGMTWENHGRFGWHIDHIKPLSGFDLTKSDQLKEACHYSNLQPMWWRPNIIKGGSK